MFTEVRDLGVESVLEQWNAVGESGNSTGTGNTPEDQVSSVCLNSREVDTRLGDFVGWTSNVLKLLVYTYRGGKRNKTY